VVSSAKRNAVGYLPYGGTPTKKMRGRPRLYGQKIKLSTLFENPDAMQTAESPVYGEKGVVLKYRFIDLLLRPRAIKVRFVAVIHPTRGSSLFVSTDLSLHPVEIIRLYGLRFKIEVSFKQALRTLGSYAYHFWMMSMTPLRKASGDQYLHRKSDRYRNKVRRKLNAYHRFIQIGLIAQGLLQFLAVSCPALVWAHFNSWIRTIRPGIPPSEFVTSIALRNSFPEFLSGSSQNAIFTKFLIKRLDFSKSKNIRLAA
jgi:hypothetical protein